MTRSQRPSDPIQLHLGLVQPIARHYARQSGQDIDDLIQVGRLGLLKAASGFRSDQGCQFKTYARPHIRGAILHYLRDQSSLVRLPRRVEERVQGLRRGEQLSLTPADDLLLQQYANKHGWTELRDHHIDTSEDVLERLSRNLEQQKALTALKTLPREERDAVQAVVMRGDSLRRVARQRNVSAMTIQRRVKRGLSRLCDQLRPSGSATQGC